MASNPKNIDILKQREDDLDFIINAAELALWDLDPATNKFTGNHRLKEWFCLPPHEEIILPLALSRIAATDRENVIDAIKKALRPGSDGNYNIEYTIINPADKSKRIVVAKGKAVFDQNNIPYRFSGTLQDITKEKEAAESIIKSEKQFRNLVLRSPIPMAIIKGKEYFIEVANDVMYNKIWRKKAEEVQGKKLLDVFPELKQQKYPELINTVLTTGEACRETESIAYVQGDDGMKRFYLDYEYAPLFEIDNSISGIIITVNDVTEKVEARQKIQDAEERARLAITAGELGVYELDMKTNKLMADSRFYEIFGFDHQVSWQEIINTFHPEDLKIRQQAHTDSLQNGMLEYEARFVRKDASIHWLKIKGIIIFDDKEPLKILGIVADISKQKAFEATLENKVQERTQELAEANRQLHQSNIELNQFAYIASHDLQEPLRKVRTFIELMQVDLGDVPDKSKIYITKILSAAERMQNLINDVLKFSALSKEREKFEQVDLNKILSNITSDYELLIEQKNAILTTETLPVVEAIPLQMAQLFTNLISNALKFNNKNQQLKISVKAHILSKEDFAKYEGFAEQIKYYVIEFKDNGIGFDQENAEQIFTIFQRLHGKAEYEGTGIGLAMCKKIIQNHHGFISAKSSEGKGATFTIIIPQTQNV